MHQIGTWLAGPSRINGVSYGILISLVGVMVQATPAMALNDLLYQDSGSGQWWSSTYQSAGVGPASSLAGGPDVNLGYANDRKIRLGNHNNDAAGRIDHIYQDPNSAWFVRTYDPDPNNQPGPAFTALGGAESGDPYIQSNATEIQLGDYNNNGKIDLLYLYDDVWWARTSQPSGTQPGPLGSQAIADVQLGLFGPSASEIKIADWNNDGSIDFLYYYPPGNQWYARTYFDAGGDPNNPGGIMIGESLMPTVNGARPFIIADYDNDGISEIIYQDSGNWYGREYSATVSGEPAGTQVGSEVTLVNNAANIAVGDYNNDGQIDFIYKDTSSSWWFARTYDSSNTYIGGEVNLGFAAADMLIIGNLNNSSAPVLIPGDFDGDGDVDGDDLGDWEVGYGTVSGAATTDGDADVDGDVDGGDFLIWQQNYTGPIPLGAIAAVPEPSTLWLTFTMVAMLGQVRLRRQIAEL